MPAAAIPTSAPPTAIPANTATPESSPVVALATATPALGANDNTNGSDASLDANIGTEIGDIAPGFVLPSALDGDFDLSAFRGEKNVALVFYRAFW